MKESDPWRVLTHRLRRSQNTLILHNCFIKSAIPCNFTRPTGTLQHLSISIIQDLHSSRNLLHLSIWVAGKSENPKAGYVSQHMHSRKASVDANTIHELSTEKTVLSTKCVLADLQHFMVVRLHVYSSIIPGP